MAEARKVPPIPKWLTGKMSAPDEQVVYIYPDGTSWASNPGPQTWLQLCPCDEIVYGGRRGGGKSNGLIAWMASGDPDLSEDDPARWSYLNEPSFKGLFLREKITANKDFLDEVREFYRPFGVIPKGNPVEFLFPSGAKIATGHLKDAESFNSYKGWGLTRIGVEELTQIKKLDQYRKLLGSLRNKKQVRFHDGRKFPPLRCQIVSTTNPDGPGAGWVTARFVDVYDGKGKLVPWNTPVRDKISGATRIFIPAGLKDNPYLADNPSYNAMLLSQNEVTRKQWMDGDWHAQSGIFFNEYRPLGPIGDEEETETPWARHLIESTPLKPWWRRWGSGDWGYDHPALFHKYCWNEHDGRLHVYDELSLRKVGSFAMGALLARWWSPELDGLPEHAVTLYLSHDAFLLRKAYDEPTTRAEQIANGINSVLGPFSAFILNYDHDESALRAVDEQAALRRFEKRRKEAEGRVCIWIKRANPDRIGGFSYIRDLMRFKPVTLKKPDDEYFRKILNERGVAEYEKELDRYRSVPNEQASAEKGRMLPGIQVWKQCKELDYCLRNARYEEGKEDIAKWNYDESANIPGDDAVESLRNGVNAFKVIRDEVRPPQSYYVIEQIDKAQQQYMENFGSRITDPAILGQIALYQEAKYRQKYESRQEPITLPRGVGRLIR